MSMSKRLHARYGKFHEKVVGSEHPSIEVLVTPPWDDDGVDRPDPCDVYGTREMVYDAQPRRKPPAPRKTKRELAEGVTRQQVTDYLAKYRNLPPPQTRASDLAKPATRAVQRSLFE